MDFNLSVYPVSPICYSFFHFFLILAWHNKFLKNEFIFFCRSPAHPRFVRGSHSATNRLKTCLQTVNKLSDCTQAHSKITTWTTLCFKVYYAHYFYFLDSTRAALCGGSIFYSKLYLWSTGHWCSTLIHPVSKNKFKEEAFKVSFLLPHKQKVWTETWEGLYILTSSL